MVQDRTHAGRHLISAWWDQLRKPHPEVRLCHRCRSRLAIAGIEQFFKRAVDDCPTTLTYAVRLQESLCDRFVDGGWSAHTLQRIGAAALHKMSLDGRTISGTKTKKGRRTSQHNFGTPSARAARPPCNWRRNLEFRNPRSAASSRVQTCECHGPQNWLRHSGLNCAPRENNNHVSSVARCAPQFRHTR